MYNEEVTLISYETTRDKLKNRVKTPIATKVLCRIMSVGDREFYQAAVNDLKPELKIVVHDFEYSDEKELIYNGTRYKVIRTFKSEIKQFKGESLKNLEFDEIELTCERVIGNG